VEGHSDSSPINSGEFSSNWDLSLARAIQVVNYFTEVTELSANRFRVGGYGPSRPLVPNDTPENRQKNRRIEVFLYQKD
jgi:chemotaxis protein MotB